jgi:hypothetical protein
MHSMKLLAQLATLALCGALLACGTPGAPRPPSLQLPRPVDDLTATRKGDRVTLTWTPSNENTDGTAVRRAGPTRICRGVNDFPMTGCVQALADVSVAPAAPVKGQREAKVSYTDTLPAQLEQQNPTGFATYAVEMLNRRDRSAGLSNQVRVPLAPAPPPPAHVDAKVTAEGVDLSAYGVTLGPAPAGVSTEFHLYRRSEANAVEVDLGGAGNETRIGSPATGEHAVEWDFLDRSAEWEKTYLYHVAAVVTVKQGAAQVQFQGNDSPEIKVFVHDIFPPAQPVGLQAVASGVGQKPFIDLTWASNQEADLAGYNVYRREQGEWVCINKELVKAPAFRDTGVAPGHAYFYAVSAVDLRNNESPKSEPASETVPNP